MKVTPRLLGPWFGLFLLAAFLGTRGTAADQPSQGDFDTRPEDPAVSALQVEGEGATVLPGAEKNRCTIRFSPQPGRPAALLSFADLPLTDRLGVALDVTNTGSQPVRVFGDLNEINWLRGYVTVPPGRTETLYVFARLKTSARWPAIGTDDAPGFPDMHGLPGGRMFLWEGLDNPPLAKSLKVFVVLPREEITLEVGNLRAFGSSTIPEAAVHGAFIDRYGQYKLKDWPGKIHSDADMVANRDQEDQDLAAHPPPSGLDQYGGWAAGPQLKATGHFRTEKYQGKWWLVDPEGRLFWSDGIDVVAFNLSSTHTTGRERFYDDPAPQGEFLERNLRIKYGPDWGSVARNRILLRLRSWGLNTIGGASDADMIRQRRVPYTLLLWTGERAGGSALDPDSTAWAGQMRRVLAAAAGTAKDDPWCLGFFVDNEIHVSTDPAWFERYYRHVSAVAKAVMPDTLYLGSRLDYHDWPDVPEYRKEIVRIAARYCDVISFNFYKYTVDDVALPCGVDRPALIGEFHMGALDRGLFHTGLRGVISQTQRAEAYRLYVTSALRNPAIVGAHWFQLYDESTTGRRDGENYQIGFLDIGDTPYAETIAAARDIGARLYIIRTGP